MSIAIDRERLQLEIHQACADLRVAQERLDQASPLYIDSAVLAVNACQSRVDALLREYKQEFGTDGGDA